MNGLEEGESTSRVLEYAPITRRHSTISRIIVWLFWATMTHPILFVVSLYSEWLWAWSKLGYAPGYGDPSHQSPVLDWFTSQLLEGLPVSLFTWIPLICVELIASRSFKLLLIRIIITIMTWTVFAALFRFDPVEAVSWWFD